MGKDRAIPAPGPIEDKAPMRDAVELLTFLGGATGAACASVPQAHLGQPRAAPQGMPLLFLLGWTARRDAGSLRTLSWQGSGLWRMGG